MNGVILPDGTYRKKEPNPRLLVYPDALVATPHRIASRRSRVRHRYHLSRSDRRKTLLLSKTTITATRGENEPTRRDTAASRSADTAKTGSQSYD